MSISKRNPDIFNNIIGYEYAKQEFLSILFALDNRAELTANGVTIPHGMLLYGNHSTINEYLAENLITESGYDFHFYDGDDDALAEFYKSVEPEKNYILYITGFDKKLQEASSDFPKILASIMECVDNDNIFVIATAEDADEIPKEWFQPLRFFRKIGVYLQSYSEAVSMLHILCEKKNLPEELENEDLYGLLANSTFPVMEALIDDAILHSSYTADGQLNLTIPDIVEAKKRWKLQDDVFRRLVTEEEYRRIAYHEAGHLLVAELLQPGITGYAIISNAVYGEVNGITGRRHTWIESDNDIIYSLAGKAAEDEMYGIDGGSSESDIESVFDSILYSVTKRGSCGLSHIKFKNGFSAQSDKLNESQERAIYSLVDEKLQEARKLVSENRKLLDALASKLSRQGYLVRSDIEEIMYS